MVKLLTASETAYSANPGKGTSDINLLAGDDATLVALVQVSLQCSEHIAGACVLAVLLSAEAALTRNLSNTSDTL